MTLTVAPAHLKAMSASYRSVRKDAHQAGQRADFGARVHRATSEESPTIKVGLSSWRKRRGSLPLDRHIKDVGFGLQEQQEIRDPLLQDTSQPRASQGSDAASLSPKFLKMVWQKWLNSMVMVKAFGIWQSATVSYTELCDKS